MEILISFSSLLISIINILGIGLTGLYLTLKNRTSTLFDKMFSLSKELDALKKQEKPNTNDISELQLRIKHLMMEVLEMQKWRFPKLTQSQNRLMADCCEALLYYNLAQKYWNRCFSSSFLLAEVESEYHRRYAQFLYQINEYAEGDKEFEKALLLVNSNDGRKYINAFTYYQWGGCINVLMDNNKSKDPSINVEDYKELIVEKLNKAEKAFDTIINGQMKRTGKKMILDFKKEYCPWVKTNNNGFKINNRI